MEVAVTGALLLLWVLFIFIFYSLKMYKKKSQLPPGPTPWFFLVNLLQKDVMPLSKNYSKLVEKYGPVFTVWMGPKPMVVLCGFDVVKDALMDHAEEFGGRISSPISERMTKGHGIDNSSDMQWRELRRFTVMTLRDFGMGKRSMSERVQEEAVCLVEALAATKGQGFDPTTRITSAVSNVISSVIFGTRFDYADKTFLKHQRIIENQVVFFQSFLGLLYSAVPKILDCFPGRHQNAFSDTDELCAFIRENVKVHRQTLDPQNIRDYIDCFLIKSEKEQKSASDTFRTENLVMTVFGLFLAGTGTTSVFLISGLMVMAKLPHIQAKVQQEIDEVTSATRAPSMEDRVRMPFTNAVIHEILRYPQISNETIPRTTSCDTKFRGFTIPKGTAVAPMLTTVHRDPLQWETPKQFNPGHFLDEKGQFKKKNALIAFSAGKRACIGEALARMELFLFFSTLLQNFTFQLVGAAKDIDLASLFMEFNAKNVCPLMKAIRRSV
ncbi:cytochrome P450 2C8-like [Podarcis raffonei]|uniref:cytochrome P450 2C8-like n=1 Tax=Podarcis raffonei TaxID=65483 RepID=UPI0023294AD6|nr:cytochrome P450 2C8-like [Podarcis raffonei]XP_053232117.1 cytochrome P450 2C8-like [Podarcis raffonei]XP_053232118.1 cytochrome P450 2C8-like [Podarcis raffonei]